MAYSRLSNSEQISKYDEWIPSTIVLDPDALQRIFHCKDNGVKSRDVDSFVDEMKQSERASELLESYMRKWLGGEEEADKGRPSNRRLTQRARARLLTVEELYKLIPGSKRRDIIMRGAHVKAYFWDFLPPQSESGYAARQKMTASLVFSFLSSKLNTDDPQLRSRIRLILQTRLADNYVETYFYLNTNHAMSDLVHNQYRHHFRAAPISQVLDQFRHEHYFYLQISLDQTQHELEGYLDDVNRFACLLGEKDGRDAGSQAFMEYEMIKKWQKNRQTQAMVHDMSAMDTCSSQAILQRHIALIHPRKRPIEELSPEPDDTPRSVKRRKHEKREPKQLMAAESKPLNTLSDPADQEPPRFDDSSEQLLGNQDLNRQSDHLNQLTIRRETPKLLEPCIIRSSCKNISRVNGTIQTQSEKDAAVSHSGLEMKQHETTNEEESKRSRGEGDPVEEKNDAASKSAPEDFILSTDSSTKAEVVDTKPWLMTRDSTMDNVNTGTIKSVQSEEETSEEEISEEETSEEEESEEEHGQDKPSEEATTEEDNRGSETSKQDKERNQDQQMRKNKVQDSGSLQPKIINRTRVKQRTSQVSDAESNSTAQQEKPQISPQIFPSSKASLLNDHLKSYPSAATHKDLSTVDSGHHPTVSHAGFQSLRSGQHDIPLPPGIYDDSENDTSDESDDQSSDSTSAAPDMVAETLRMLSQSRNARKTQAKMEHLNALSAEEAEEQASHTSNIVPKLAQNKELGDNGDLTSHSGSSSPTTDYASDSEDDKIHGQSLPKPTAPSTMLDTAAKALTTAALALNPITLEEPMTDKDISSQSLTQNPSHKSAPSRDLDVTLETPSLAIPQRASDVAVQHDPAKDVSKQHALGQITHTPLTGTQKDPIRNTTHQLSKGSPTNETKKKGPKATGSKTSVVKTRAPSSVTKTSGLKSLAAKSTTAKARASKITESPITSTPSRKQSTKQKSTRTPKKVKETAKPMVTSASEGLHFKDIKAGNKT